MYNCSLCVPRRRNSGKPYSHCDAYPGVSGWIARESRRNMIDFRFNKKGMHSYKRYIPPFIYFDLFVVTIFTLIRNFKALLREN